MKFAIAIIASSIYTAQATLSAMRVGPRSLNRVGQRFEFGREVDVGDEDAAFAELNAAHKRLLQDASFLNSMSYPGMSLSSFGMSFRRMPEERLDDDGFKRLMADAALNQDVISLERYELAEENSPVGLTAATGSGSKESSQEYIDLALFVVVSALMVVVVYRRKRATQKRSYGEDRSECISSSILGDDMRGDETMGASV
ncbi:hypothetical protein MHU86_14275 [Fragilaria crotonensis]|nr:hypothetical protein MHU86_14275 [Fragilaria crotonensis]